MTKEEKMNLLIEDSMLSINNRELNSKEKRIFKIDVNQITPQEAIEQLKNSILK